MTRTEDRLAFRRKAFMQLAPTAEHMLSAWLGCLHWAMGEPVIVDTFFNETGQKLPLPSPDVQLNRFVQDDIAFKWLISFTKWVNKNVWGETDGRASNGTEDLDERKAAAVRAVQSDSEKRVRSHRLRQVR